MCLSVFKHSKELCVQIVSLISDHAFELQLIGQQRSLIPSSILRVTLSLLGHFYSIVFF